MSFDRVLQLKLIADVNDINRKMGQVGQDVGRAKKAFGTLKSFAGPILANLALTGATMVVDSFKAQLEHAEALRRAFVGLEAAGDALDLPTGKIRRSADALRDIGVSLGVGEDSKIVTALSDITRMTGKLGLAERSVEAIFDVMRLMDVDFDTAKGLVINGIILGRSRQLDQLGVSGDTAKERLRNFNTSFSEVAEDFAGTADGKWQIATAQWDGHMLNLAILADQALLDLKGALVVGWDNLTGIIDGFATIWSGISAKWESAIDGLEVDIGQLVGNVQTLLEPVLAIVDEYFIGPFRAALNILGVIFKLITLDLAGAKADVVGLVKGLANSVIGMLNTLSNAFAFDAVFTFPSITVPDLGDPIGAIKDGKTVTIGGGTVDFSRGPLFDPIPTLAKGGIVSSPTLALIGEGRHDEAVIPLDGRRLGASYTINVQAGASSPADVGRAVVEAIEAYERRAGAGWRR